MPLIPHPTPANTLMLHVGHNYVTAFDAEHKVIAKIYNAKKDNCPFSTSDNVGWLFDHGDKVTAMRNNGKKLYAIRRDKNDVFNQVQAKKHHFSVKPKLG